MGWPWLGTLIVPIPILLSSISPMARDNFWDETFCPLYVELPARLAVLILVFYMPLALVLILCSLIGWIMYCDMAAARDARHGRWAGRHSWSHAPHSLHDTPTDRDTEGESGGRGVRDAFPASGANRPLRLEVGRATSGGGMEGVGGARVRDARGGANGHVGRAPGSPIYKGRRAGAGTPRSETPPTLASLRIDPAARGDRSPTATTTTPTPTSEFGGPVWAVDDNEDDPTHVMMGPAEDHRDASPLQLTEGGERQRSATDGLQVALTTTVTTRDRPQPSVTLVGMGGGWRPGGGATNGSITPGDAEGQRLVVGGWTEAEGESCLEKPMHMMLPLVVVVVCALPLMVAWWFYGVMPNDVVIIVSIILSRLYLLRAALLPAAWFALPELRHLACHLWARVNGCCHWCGGGGLTGEEGVGGEGGAFSVAYSTLHETTDAPQADRQRQARAEVTRVNPFDSDVRA